MSTEHKIEDTTEAWEDGTLGTDPNFISVVEHSEAELAALNSALNLTPIILLLEDEVVKLFEEEAVKRGLWYKTLMRVALKQFVNHQTKPNETQL